MSKKLLTVYAPASSGNVSVGFDALGLALAPVDGSLLGDCVSIMPGDPDDWTLCLDGQFAHALPQDQELNIVISSCRRFEKAALAAGIVIRPLNITLDKRLPVGSGLGSSASSIVATLVALNQYFGRPLDRPALLNLMAEMEGSISGEVHLDNIAPCLLGGLRLCTPGSARQYGLPWPGHWQSVVAWPGTRLETRPAREVLPVKYDRKTVVAHGAQFALFVHQLHQGEAGAAANCLVDLLAEPYRKTLLPGFEEARAALRQMGVLATGISGSGPTVFCIVDDSCIAEAAADWLETHYLKNESGFVHICRADLAGARKV
ncbi:MAG: homoserine kinase [Gammaproteobacteria bacterium]|nr:homoserine kinase [Gammaproteobacteria bacterium]